MEDRATNRHTLATPVHRTHQEGRPGANDQSVGSAVIRTLLGYLVFVVVMLLLLAALTAYYVWRARMIGRKWWRRAEKETTDPTGRRE